MHMQEGDDARENRSRHSPDMRRLTCAGNVSVPGLPRIPVLGLLNPRSAHGQGFIVGASRARQAQVAGQTHAMM
jgi:hypothetical protein